MGFINMKTYKQLGHKIKCTRRHTVKRQQHGISGWDTEKQSVPQQQPLCADAGAFKRFIPRTGAPHWAIRCSTSGQSWRKTGTNRTGTHSNETCQNSVTFWYSALASVSWCVKQLEPAEVDVRHFAASEITGVKEAAVGSCVCVCVGVKVS